MPSSRLLPTDVDGRRLPRVLFILWLNSLHPLAVDTLYPHSVVCGFTISTFSRLWIHWIHIQSCGFTASTVSTESTVSTFSHPAFIPFKTDFENIVFTSETKLVKILSRLQLRTINNNYILLDRCHWCCQIILSKPFVLLTNNSSQQICRSVKCKQIITVYENLRFSGSFKTRL
jgi:hypothetical protein